MIVVQLRLSWPSEKAMSQELASQHYLTFRGILEPGFDIVEMFHGNRVDVDWGPMKVLENHNKIKIFQSKLKWVRKVNRVVYLNTFEMGNFDVGEGDHQERRFRQTDETIGRGLQINIRSRVNPIEPKIPERHIHLDLTIALPNQSVAKTRKNGRGIVRHLQSSGCIP
jgi:hypothetical protein